MSDEQGPNKPEDRSQRRPSEPPAVPPDPDLERVLRDAGVNPRDPEVRRALHYVEISAIRASGVLPLPPPNILAQYKEIIPDLPERFVWWTEQQAEHRRELEKVRANGQERRMDRGQFGSLIVAVISIIAAAIVGAWGHEWAAAAIVAAGVGGPAALAILAYNSKIAWSFNSSPTKERRVAPTPADSKS